MKYDPFIYGRNQEEKVVGLEQDGENAIVYYHDRQPDVVANERFILTPESLGKDSFRLAGGLFFQWCTKYQTTTDYQADTGKLRAMKRDYFTVYNPLESLMVKDGITFYKGMKPKDVSVLSFDIETTGIDPATNKVLMISNTYRNGEKLERRLFSIDEFNSEKEMIYAWCIYVNECDPGILLGHNVFGFDLPFLTKRLRKALPIGRMQKPAKSARRVSQFRKDGSQSYDYTNVIVPGREVIDTFHLAIKFDTARRYPSYGLKPIIEFEGLEREGRTHWDFSNGIPDPNSPSWDEFKDYCKDDADDSLALFDLMIPAYFYYAQHIPKTMQQIISGATGSQVNSFMVRAYLNDRHSIPKADETYHYPGGHVDGNIGIHKYVGKYDVASLYPSIIRQYKITDGLKDPKNYFLKMVDYFTDERLENKRMAAETGERHYNDMSNAQKIVINSAYGFLGAPGLQFNSPANAELVTKYGREILQKGIDWAEAKGWTIVNADTDSFSFKTGRPFTRKQFLEWNDELNALYPKMIYWEPDGFHKDDTRPGMFTRVVVVKSKNYILQDTDGHVLVKGSGLKATMKEPALKEFIDDVIECMLQGDKDAIRDIYLDYAKLCCDVNMDSIAKWCSKKTITKAVLQPKRTTEQRILDAVHASGMQVSEGDKIFVFFQEDTVLRVRQDFNQSYSKKKLLTKLYKTAEIFKELIGDEFKEMIPNMALKRNQKLLEKLTTPATGDLQPGGQTQLSNYNINNTIGTIASG